MNILIIEDDLRVADFLLRGLKAEGHTINLCHTGNEGLARAKTGDAQLIILDVMLPGMNGLDVCRTLRLSGLGTPILMLSAMDTMENRVTGLRSGADDYLAKPFAFEELLAKIEALSRRGDWHTDQAATHVLKLGDIKFNFKSMVVTHGDVVINLTAKELSLLELFMRNPERVYSRERILSNVWGAQEDPLTNIVDVYIGRLRQKLGDNNSHECTEILETIRGLGYRLSCKEHAH